MLLNVIGLPDEISDGLFRPRNRRLPSQLFKGVFAGDSLKPPFLEFVECHAMACLAEFALWIQGCKCFSAP
jgi:hypothetical protein